jgi:TolB-like protein
MTLWSAEIKELETLYTSIKGKFPELEKELEQLKETKDANVVLLYSRRCLEVIITDLCESELKRPRKTEPLKGIIDKLSHEDKVPSHIITSMQNLNSLSTYGAHPKEFDPEQVKPVLNNLTTILKWYLKYKDTQAVTKPTAKEVVDETKAPDDSTEQIQKPKQKLILLLSGLALVVVIIVVALFVFNIIGGGKQAEELEKSIAVLPFFNDSEDQENTYFINGIMDEVLINLQTIKDLRVVSRSSVEQYRDPSRPTSPEIARKLNVNFLVEGSGQKYGNTFVLRVQLLEAAKDKHLWGESYEQRIDDIDDIIRIQSQIADAIAHKLMVIITPEEKQLIEQKPTTSLTALDLYQKGREEHWTYWTDNDNREALERAGDLYHEALQYDSKFAQAYTGLARVFWDKHYWETYFSENFLDSVLILADIALSYNDQLEEAYYVRGEYYRQNGEASKALDNYDKALKINPNYAAAYDKKGYLLRWVFHDYVKCIDNYNKAVMRNRGKDLPDLFYSLGDVYMEVGFIDKGKYYYKEALTLDGDSASYFKRLAWLEFSLENFEKAIEFLEKALAIDSTNIPFDPYYTYAGKDKEAYNYYTKLIKIYKKSGTLPLQASHRIGYAYWKVGKYKEAEYYFNEQIRYGTESIKLGRLIASRKAAQYDLACVYAFLGDKVKAYQYLDEVNEMNYFPNWWVVFAKHDPLLESIRNEERFQKILQDMESKYQAEHERVRKWLEENDSPG